MRMLPVILQALGGVPSSEGAQDEAQALNREAAELAKRVEGGAGANGAGGGALSAPLLSKLGAVQAHLAAVQQAAT